MNKEDEMIEKSISQMGYYLKLNNYVIEPISKKKYDDLKKGYNEIKVFYHKKELIDKHPKVYLFYSYETFNKNTLDKIISNITPNHFLSKKNNNPDKIHKKKKVLIVNIELKNSNQNINFSIANTHLTGNKTRNEVRIEEIKHIMSMQNNCKFKFNNLIVGDFNYSNYKDIQNLITVNNYNMIDDYFLNNNFKSSFHKFNIKDWKQKKKEMYEEDIIYDTIDYILYSNTLEPIKDRLLILPNQETGVINANLPYQPKNNNNKDWYSDHVLIYQEFNII